MTLPGSKQFEVADQARSDAESPGYAKFVEFEFVVVEPNHVDTIAYPYR